MSKRRSDKRKGGKKSGRQNPLGHVHDALLISTPTMSYSPKKERQILRKKAEQEEFRRGIQAAANNLEDLES